MRLKHNAKPLEKIGKFDDIKKLQFCTIVGTNDLSTIFAIGGLPSSGGKSKIYNWIRKYNVNGNKWTTLNTKLPEPLYGCGALILQHDRQKYLVTFGGHIKKHICTLKNAKKNNTYLYYYQL